MGNSIVKNTIGILVLIVLSFIVGIMAADDKKSSVMLICAMAGCGVIVAMGKRVWYALFLLVPICKALPTVKEVPLEYPIEAIVLCYWTLLCIIGRARFTWRKLIGADLLVLLLVGIMVFTYIRYPVSVQMFESLFGFKAEYTRGKAYIYMIFFIINYICFSCIPFERKKLKKLLKWNLVLLLVFHLLIGTYEIFSKGSTLGEQRIGQLKEFGTYLFIAVYCSAPLSRILTSPTIIFSIIVSFFCNIITGFRSYLFVFFIDVISCILIKREYFFFIFSAIIGLSFIFIFSASGTLQNLPFTFQRSLSVIPGLKLSQDVINDGNGSTDWRILMWKWALDPRTGYIKDYVFGDGIGFKTADVKRIRRDNLYEPDYAEGLYAHQKSFAAQRLWHSGIIECIQSIGYAGLFVVFIIQLYAIIIMIKVNTALRNTPYFVYSMVYTCTAASYMIHFFAAAGSLSAFFLKISALSYIKVFHSIAIEEGKIVLGHRRKLYIPKLIQEENRN